MAELLNLSEKLKLVSKQQLCKGFFKIKNKNFRLFQFEFHFRKSNINNLFSKATEIWPSFEKK